MTCRSQHAWLLAAVTLLATLAPSLGGQWCEDFESGAGTFWSQRSYSGNWQHTTYTEESKSGDPKIPKPSTGEDGMMLLRPSRRSDTAASRLVSPELVFSSGASIELTYWLWHTGSHSQVKFQLYRLVNGVEDKEPFLNITGFSTNHDSSWSTLQAGLNLDRGAKIRVAIYGYLDGESPANIALDRIILREVNDNNACGEMRSLAPTEEPGPEGPNFDFFCPTEYGLFMDPESCAFYYNCNYWNAVHMPCYTGLVFNPENSMCDYLKVVPSCQ